MLYPAMSSLLEHVNSRYLLVNVIARRARQLSIESEITHEAPAAPRRNRAYRWRTARQRPQLWRS